MSLCIRTFVPALLLPVLVVAGCGDATDYAGTATCVSAADVAADTGTGVAVRGIAIAAQDDEFHPRCVEIETAGQVRIVVRNDGRHPHNFTVHDRQRVAVDAGQVAILDLEVPAGGVQYVCTIHPGMDGEIRVRP